MFASIRCGGIAGERRRCSAGERDDSDATPVRYRIVGLGGYVVVEVVGLGVGVVVAVVVGVGVGVGVGREVDLVGVGRELVGALVAVGVGVGVGVGA
ncbi:MAG: hypothetical protein WCP28_18570 [Actinomycetes bacterium]